MAKEHKIIFADKFGGKVTVYYVPPTKEHLKNQVESWARAARPSIRRRIGRGENAKSLIKPIRESKRKWIPTLESNLPELIVRAIHQCLSDFHFLQEAQFLKECGYHHESSEELPPSLDGPTHRGRKLDETGKLRVVLRKSPGPKGGRPKGRDESLLEPIKKAVRELHADTGKIPTKRQVLDRIERTKIEERRLTDYLPKGIRWKPFCKAVIENGENHL